MRSGERPKISISPVRPGETGEVADRRLAAVAFVDIVGYTILMANDETRTHRRWMRILSEVISPQAERFHGTVVKSTGDGFLATFDGPARAIECARALNPAAETLGIQLRAGIHTGECEVIGEDIAGMCVHLAARVCGVAAPGEVLVSRTVKDLVVGSGIEFSEHGVHELTGVPGEWELFSLAGADRC